MGAMKPAQSGHEAGEPSDADRLRAAAGGTDAADLVCPYTLGPPLAPAVAARLEGKTLSLSVILEVEGAGGLMTPLTERETFADLAVAFGLPVLVVARAGLGTVNHVALTCEALRARGLFARGIVLNRTSRQSDPSEPHNAGESERLTGVRVLATLPFERDLAVRERLIAEELSREVQF